MKQNANYDFLFISSIIIVPLIVSKDLYSILYIMKNERDTFSNPAKGVSGDYYEVIKLRDNKIALII